MIKKFSKLSKSIKRVFVKNSEQLIKSSEQSISRQYKSSLQFNYCQVNPLSTGCYIQQSKSKILCFKFSSSKQKSIQQLFNEANNCFKQQRFIQAEELYQNILLLNPSVQVQTLLLLNLAKIYYFQLKHQKITQILSKINLQHRNTADYYHVCALVKMAQNNYKQAQNFLLKAHEKQPQSITILIQILKLYSINVDFHLDMIQKYLQKIQKLQPKNFIQLSDICQALIIARYLQKAQQYVKKAISLFPQKLAAYCIKISILFEQQKYQQLIQLYQKLIKKYQIFQFNPLTFCAVANALLELNRFDEAILQADKVTTLNKIAFYNAQFLKGNALCFLNKLDEALQCFFKSFKINKKFSEPLIAIGDVYLIKKQLDKALLYFQKALMVQNVNPLAYQKLAALYIDSNRFEDCLNCIQKIMKINPYRSDLLIMKGTAYCKLGDFQKAIQTLNKVLQKSPSDIIALQVKSFCLIQSGKVNEGQEILQRIINQNPSYQRLFNLASCFNQNFDYDKAQAYLLKAIQMQPERKQAQQYLNMIRQTRLNDYK